MAKRKETDRLGAESSTMRSCILGLSTFMTSSTGKICMGVGVGAVARRAVEELLGSGTRFESRNATISSSAGCCWPSLTRSRAGLLAVLRR